MSNSADSPSTLWRLRPAIYGTVQNYIASETSLMPYVPVRIKETKKMKDLNFKAKNPGLCKKDALQTGS